MSTALIPSVPIERLVLARDGLLDAYRKAAELIVAAYGAFPDLGGAKLSLPSVAIETSEGHFGLLHLAGERSERYAEDLRSAIDRRVWAALFEASGLDQIMSSDARRKLSDMLYSGSGQRGRRDELPPLTVENVRATFEGHALRADETFGECVEALYRRLSWNYKTNEPYRLGRRMIVSGAFGRWTSIGRSEPLADLERALHVLAKRPQPTYEVGVRALHDAPFGAWVEPTSTEGGPLLRVKRYKNGNAHVEIIDAGLVDGLNRVMAGRRPFAIGSRRAS